MSSKLRIVPTCCVIFALVAALCVGCAEKEEEGKVVITVGNITDLSGPAAPALVPMTWAIEGLARYINEEEPIPGVEIKVVHYDAKYDPARDIPGYEWARERGAKVISTPLPTTAATLKPISERDQIPIFTWGSSTFLVEPPGWVFCYNPTASQMIKTILKWISEEHWDYAKGIPKIGIAGWSEPYQSDLTRGIQEYCAAHPDKFEFVAGFLAPMGAMTWSGEVEALKGCDYVGLPSTGTGTATFIREFRDKGYAATLIGTDAVPAFTSLLVNACGWEYLDGMLTIHGMGWFEPAPLNQLVVDLATQNHPEEADELLQNTGWLSAIHGDYLVFDMLRKAVEEVGIDNFDGKAFYDVAVGFTASYEGLPEWGFTATTRHAVKDMAVYEWSAEAEDLVGISGWIPLAEE